MLPLKCGDLAIELKTKGKFGKIVLPPPSWRFLRRLAHTLLSAKSLQTKEKKTTRHIATVVFQHKRHQATRPRRETTEGGQTTLVVVVAIPGYF